MDVKDTSCIVDIGYNNFKSTHCKFSSCVSVFVYVTSVPALSSRQHVVICSVVRGLLTLGFSGNPRSNREVPRDQVNDGAMLPSTNKLTSGKYVPE
jgi:hypothetical protein